MPELPEVETIRKDLSKNIIGKKIIDANFLWPGILKEITVEDFKKLTLGESIISVNRRAKNLDIELSNNLFLLLHMKMTGHLIIADDHWKVDDSGRWEAQDEKKSPLNDPLNQYIRATFSLDNGKLIAFSDLRKFAYLKVLTKKGLEENYLKYGPEPLGEAFTFDYLQDVLSKKSGPIKKVIMDQALVAGIGNIYADEILFYAKIHPLQVSNSIPAEKVKILYNQIRQVLRKAISLRGTSTSDFRDPSGSKGMFGDHLAVYRRTGLPCPNDGTPIKRIVVGGRGTHFCPKDQRLEEL